MPPDAYGATMRVLRPAENVYAFYDGRIAGTRLFSPEPNWVDDGAYALGIASYAIVDGNEALVYDTHISLQHAQIIRHTLRDRGVTSIRVVLSHYHDDHVAGNEVFADCEIVANELTARLLTENRAKYEAATPPIRPLVMPTRTFAGRLDLKIGSIPVELHHFDIHSIDETLLWLPERRLLLAGDALEDTVTYVDEPDRLANHLLDLDRLSGWPIDRILPNHGDPDIIAQGGYARSLIDATKTYVQRLLLCKSDPSLAAKDLRSFIAEELATGALSYFAPYETVHRDNVRAVLSAQKN